MICKKCQKDNNRVHATLDNFMLPVKVRHRLCMECGHRWVTEERDTGETWGSKPNGTPDMFEDTYYVERREHERERQREEEITRIVRKINEAAK